MVLGMVMVMVMLMMVMVIVMVMMMMMMMVMMVMMMMMMVMMTMMMMMLMTMMMNHGGLRRRAACKGDGWFSNARVREPEGVVPVARRAARDVRRRPRAQHTARGHPSRFRRVA